MSKESEIARCNQNISATEDQILSAEAKISSYKSKIEDLKKAYEAMKVAKSDFNDKKQALRNLLNDSDTSWTGSLYDTKYEKPVEVLISEVGNVIGKIDTNLDRINDRINEYENIVMQEESLLGGLYSLLNSLWGQLENLFN